MAETPDVGARAGLHTAARDDQEYDGRHTLLAAACRGGHQPLVTWVLDGLGGRLDQGEGHQGGMSVGQRPLLRWLIEERQVNPTPGIPSDGNPASRGNLEMCQWLAKHCR